MPAPLQTKTSTFLPEHIKIGALLWYSGTTSRGRWSCPAVIYRIIKRRKVFKVMSLDDMVEQDQEYPFNPADSIADDSRQSMRPATQDEVAAYLSNREAPWREDVRNARDTIRRAEAVLKRMQIFRTKYGL